MFSTKKLTQLSVLPAVLKPNLGHFRIAPFEKLVIFPIFEKNVINCTTIFHFHNRCILTESSS